MFSFLVVDDDRDAADSLANVLRLAGHDCVVAYDGRTALEEARCFHTDAVILDINMPGLTGYETASCFLNSWNQPPILVALTGLSSYEAKGEAMRSGFDAFLTKPANPNRLLAVITKLVQDRATLPHETSLVVQHALVSPPYEMPDWSEKNRV